MSFKKRKLNGFLNPTKLPDSTDQESMWQKANRDWWENNPMRYDWNEKISYKEFTKEFFKEIDSRFFADAKTFIPWRRIPFDSLIDFSSLSTKDVLEIGVGNGSHAQLLAQHARTFTGVDITKYSIDSVSKRMQCFGLKARILQMDAEHMSFEDNSFDFIWSWGVIHHSANTEKVLKEMHRVLRPGGESITMVYHRSAWNYYIMNGLLRGIFQGELFKTKSLLNTVQKHTDGAIARFYTVGEWKALVSRIFLLEKVAICGSKTDIIPLPAGKLKKSIMQLIPDGVGRFFTNQMRMGNFLVSIMKKQ